MNTKNNVRRRQSVEKIEKAFVELLQTKELKDISVSEICKITGLNRSTFYANFIDIYDLADKFSLKMEQDFSSYLSQQNILGGDSISEKNGALAVFTHIYENQIFYKTYFKLGYDKKVNITAYDTSRASKDFGDRHTAYHIEFFRNGFNAIVKMWLNGGCAETPQQMSEIIKQEYKGR